MENNPLAGTVEIDETYVGRQDNKAIGRNEGEKKIVVVGIEKVRGGVSSWYGRVIESASKANLRSFMRDHIATDALVKTDCWTG